MPFYGIVIVSQNQNDNQNHVNSLRNMISGGDNLIPYSINNC